MNYTIRYNHTGPAKAGCLADAKLAVRRQAMTDLGFALSAAPKEVVYVRAEDGIYAYLSQADADADETGANAFAVIENEDQLEA